MIAAYVVNGVKAGLVAGVVFGLLVALVANPLVAFAEERAQVEHEGATADGHDHGSGDLEGHDHAGGDAGGHDHASGGLPAIVSNGVSVLSGVLWGVFLGVAGFGIAFYVLEPIVPGSGSVRSYVFGGAGFLTASVAPWFVFPPAPPGVVRSLDPNTATLLYCGAVAAGAVASVAGMYAHDRLRDARGRLTAGVGAVLPWALFVAGAVAVAGVPTVPVPGGMSATLATGLAGLVVFGQALTWLVLAGAHARFHDSSGASAGPTDTGTVAGSTADDVPAGSP
ncbi:CbtA family protein [Halorubrum laminariae]|uniref:CbtA family protein n=1 Tax=Halorubrum laminariae TaxID=1433523 RepID=A0ABD6C2G7_9EURY|nr:CbtA family protein [Halorubrum laminariae]